MNAIQASSPVAQIVADHPACAKVFADTKIDFCCHGDVVLADACAARGIDIEDVLARLRTVATSEAPSDAPAIGIESSTAELVAHLVSRHHAYLRRTLPALEPLVAKVARVHGAHASELRELFEEFHELRAELEPHLDDEEADLFPMLMSRAPDRARLASRLAEAREEHRRVGRALTRIRVLAHDFRVPDWACGSYRMMMSELAAFEEDTLRHVHIENHVLMPRFDAPVS